MESRFTKVGLWLVALAALGLAAAISWRTQSTTGFVDLEVYRRAVRTWLAGGSLYGFRASNGDRFTYPPFAALALTPLTWLSRLRGQEVWLSISAGGTVALAGVAARATPAAVREKWATWPLLLTLIAASRPTYSDFGFGQISLLLVLAVAVDVLVLYGRAGQGVLIGAAAAIKLTPLLFIPYLWFSGRRRAAGTALATFVAASLLGSLWAPGDSWQYARTEMWSTSKIIDFAIGGNQSLLAMLTRAGAHQWVATSLWAAISAAVVVVALVRARWLTRAGERLAALVVVGSASVVASPISWTHHLYWLVLAAACPVRGSRWVRYAWVALVVLVMTGSVPAGVFPGVLSWCADNDRFLLALTVSTVIPFGSGGRRGLNDGQLLELNQGHLSPEPVH